MKFLSKEIDNIYLVDIFTPEERLKSDFQVTDKLGKFLTANTLQCKTLYPTSEPGVHQCLADIRNEIVNQKGIIIHFIGHGGSDLPGFANKGFYIPWEQIRQVLTDINAGCGDGLIVNTTCMCFGKNIFSLLPSEQKPFFAVVGSVGSNSLQARTHNEFLYSKCLQKDVAEVWLQTINNNLSYEKAPGYILKYAR